MQKPLVHLNGTSKAALAEGYHNAATAITAALNKLIEAAPNARDYYPQGPDAWALAKREHDARCETLRAVHRDMVDLYDHVDP